MNLTDINANGALHLTANALSNLARHTLPLFLQSPSAPSSLVMAFWEDVPRQEPIISQTPPSYLSPPPRPPSVPVPDPKPVPRPAVRVPVHVATALVPCARLPLDLALPPGLVLGQEGSPFRTSPVAYSSDQFAPASPISARALDAVQKERAVQRVRRMQNEAVGRVFSSRRPLILTPVGSPASAATSRTSPSPARASPSPARTAKSAASSACAYPLLPFLPRACVHSPPQGRIRRGQSCQIAQAWKASPAGRVRLRPVIVRSAACD